MIGTGVSACVVGGAGAAVADDSVSKSGAPVRGAAVGTDVSVVDGFDVTGSGVSSRVGKPPGETVVGDRDFRTGAPGARVGISVLNVGRSDVAGTGVTNAVDEGIGVTVAGVVSVSGASVEGARVGVGVGDTDVTGTGNGGCVSSKIGLGEERAVTGDGVGTDTFTGKTSVIKASILGTCTKRCKIKSVLNGWGSHCSARPLHTDGASQLNISPNIVGSDV